MAVCGKINIIRMEQESLTLLRIFQYLLMILNTNGYPSNHWDGRKMMQYYYRLKKSGITVDVLEKS